MAIIYGYIHLSYDLSFFCKSYCHARTATSRCILVPSGQYGRPKKCTQKVLVTLFRYIFHLKTKLNIVYKHLKTKIFTRDTNILPKMH